MNIIQWIMEHKWAITPTALETIIEIAGRSTDLSPETIAKAIHGSAWERYLDTEGGVIDFSTLEASNYPILDGTRRVSLADSVAILPVIGPIFPRANLLTMSGGSSIQSLAYDFNVALESKAVESIILNIDSPGGEITGVNEFADMIYAARGKKTIIAYVYGLGASAAYWIASSASEIVLSSTAEVGSIGVVAGYTDRRKEDERKGIQQIEIVSSQSPYKRPDPTTTGGRSQIQAIVDQMADVFINAVARNREVQSEEVLENYGQGKMFVGEDAVQRGLADRIGSLEILIQEQKALKAEENKQFNFFTGGPMDVKTLKAEHPAVYAEVIAIGRAEVEAEMSAKVEQARKEGAEAENARIKAIEEIKVPGASKVVAEHKFDMTKTASDIAGLILKAQQEDLDRIQSGLNKDGQDLANLASGLGTQLPANSADMADEAMVNAIAEGMNSYRK